MIQWNIEENFKTHEERIQRLEALMQEYGLRGPESKIGFSETYATEQDTAIPPNWIYLSAFCRKFQFISLTSLWHLIRWHGDYFSGYHGKQGNMVFICPERVVEFFESGMSNSSQLNRQYQQWKKMLPELRELSKKVREALDEADPSYTD